MTQEDHSSNHYVWDFPLRLFHWLLALSFGASWLTAELRNNTDLGIDFMLLHMRLGYWMIGLLVFRLIWGLWGGRHARFVDFVRGPRQVLSYARGLLSPNYESFSGHNPLGGLVVLVMLGLLLAQVGTGLFTSDDLMFAGPWVGAVDAGTSRSLSSLHERNFDWLVAVVVLHLLAIAWYLLRKGQNLVTPMITGLKPSVAPAEPASAVAATAGVLRFLVTVALAAAAVSAILYFAPEPAVLYPF